MTDDDRQDVGARERLARRLTHLRRWTRDRVQSLGGESDETATTPETEPTNTNSPSDGETPDSSLEAPSSSGSDSSITGLKQTVVPAFVRERLLAKVLAGLLLIVLISGGIGWYMYTDIDQSLGEDIDKQVRATTTLHENAYENWFSDRRQNLDSFTDDEEGTLSSSSQSSVRRTLESRRTQTEFVTHYHLVDLDSGEVFVSTYGEVEGEPISALGINESRVEQGEFVTPGQYESAEGYSALAFGQTASEFEGVDRVLIAEIDASEADLSSGEDPVIQQTIDGTSTLVVTADGDTVVGDDFSGTVPDDTNGSVVVEQGDQQIYGYQSISPDSQFVVVTQTPKSEAFALRRAVVENFGLTLLLTFLILVGVTVAGSRSLTRDLEVLNNRAQELGDGNLGVELQSGRDDEIGSLYEQFDTMRGQLREQIREATEAAERANDAKDEAEDARARAEAAKEEAETLAFQLEQRAEAYSEVMAACAEGDLSQRLDEDATNEAMADIAVSFNQMLDQWERTIVEIQQFADEVVDQSATADAGIDEIESASQSVTDATQNITDATDRQRVNVEQVSSEMSQLSATIEEVTATADTVATNASKTAEAGEEGQEAAETALDELNQIQDQATVAVEAIEQLDEGMAQIGEIIEFITEIADQTNMLALNANIEAARAGGEGVEDAGEGFGVVAEEVKQLAEETQEAANEITDVIDEVQTTTEKAVDDIHEMSQRVDDGTETVTTALDSLDEIAEMAADTNRGVQEIKTATDTQASTAQEVSQMSDDVARIAEQTASETRDVAAATQEQSASINNVSASVEELSTQARELRELLAQFDVASDETTSSVQPANVDADGGTDIE